STAAILVEPVQGEGGARAATLRYLSELRSAADEFGILLLFDEVQIGFGRSGKLFGHEWAGVAPDAMAVAKGIAGGFPMGAILATEKAAEGMTAGSHGSTFGGNPLAVAVAEAVLDELLSPGFLDRVDAVGRRLWFGLVDLVARHPAVFVDARGAGLLLGLKCVGDPGAFVAAARARGLLTVPAGENVVRLLPPLIITDADVDEALSLLDQTAKAMAAEAEVAA
ncbi:MAG: aminotransferase class III-fold pyridoxal phosphate-dependent enzyme, partial [Pseudomonadota bacterium]